MKSKDMKVNTMAKKPSYRETPEFSERMYELLTDDIRNIVNGHKHIGRQRDVLFFSYIIMLSGCFQNVFGYYFGKKVFSNLYGIAGAPPASGKSVMLLAKIIGDKIHKEYRDGYVSKLKEYEEKLSEWKKDKTGFKPMKPDHSLFFIPGNTSAAGFLRLLSVRKTATIVETEVDTLNLIFGQKFGDYSDILRKAFHHEPISSYRKTEDEYQFIGSACLTLLFTGTPNQLTTLLRSGENGLFSRFCFYVFDADPAFANPFGEDFKDSAKRIDDFSEAMKNLHFELLSGAQKEFKFTDSQAEAFVNRFPQQVEDFHEMTGSDGVSMIVRMGIIFFRIAMILTVLRNHKQDVLECDDRDFEAAGLMIDVLITHGLAVLTTLPGDEESSNPYPLATELLVRLPREFESKRLIEHLAKEGVSRRGAFRLLKELCDRGDLQRKRQGVYVKTVSENR